MSDLAIYAPPQAFTANANSLQWLQCEPGLSHPANLYALSKQHFIQGQHLNFSIINSCHTSSIVTPQNKEDALRTPHERLLSLAIVILHSWRDPLQYVISEFSATHGITNSILSKSVKIVKQMKQLAKGLTKITEQIGQLGGAIEQTVPWEHRLAEDGDSIMLQLYNLLHCFRRDTNKIDTYLKLLKCRFTQQSKC
ncbi:prolactin [Rhincodon typus]|uniref:prolactin n=1 Tax=Rhincodon typus TaxID=259920 RepID=UPI0020302E1A|nr:prolactin [Rhincodon typus]